ncbi:hypothetical protein MASR1M90_23680 [Desulfovibrionales bacterium]
MSDKIKLFESGQPSSEILFYPREDGALALQVRLDGETVWLTQAQMADLFQTTPQNITLHLKAIYAEGELNEAATCKDYLQVRQEGTRQVARSLTHLDTLIVAMGGKKLDGAGKVSHNQAIEKAEAEYAKYRLQQDALPSKVEAAYLETVKQAQRKLEGKKP